MKIHPAISSLLEKYSGIILGIVGAYLTHKFELNPFGNNGKIVDIIASFSGITFGFLFAALAILIQGGSKQLKYLKENRKALFNRIIDLNKMVVFLSLITTIFSLVIILYFGQDYSQPCKFYFKEIFVFLSISVFCYTFLFLKIFYSAITLDY